MLTPCEGNSTLAHASPAHPDTQAGLTLGVQKTPGHGPQLWRQPGWSSEEYGREHSRTQQRGVQTQAPSQTARAPGSPLPAASGPVQDHSRQRRGRSSSIPIRRCRQPQTGVPLSRKKEGGADTLRQGRTLKTSGYSKGARHKGPCIVWFYFCKMSRTGKSTGTESRLVVSRGWRGDGVTTYRVWGVLSKGRNVLEQDRGGGCPTLWLYHVPLNCSP